jgi:hypothetical protein
LAYKQQQAVLPGMDVAQAGGGRNAMFHLLQHWLRRVLAPVPADMAACEFDCDKTECLLGDWQACRRRLKVQQQEQGESPDPG